MTVRQFLDTLASATYVRMVVRRPDAFGNMNTIIDQTNFVDAFKDPMYSQFHDLLIKPVYIGKLREYTTINIEVDLPSLEDNKADNDQ